MGSKEEMFACLEGVDSDLKKICLHKDGAVSGWRTYTVFVSNVLHNLTGITGLSFIIFLVLDDMILCSFH